MDSSSVSADVVADWVIEAAHRVLDLIADLSDEQMVGPMLPTVNPLIWEVGHLAWFQERFVLRGVCGRNSLRSDSDALYDSGAIPHDTRWSLALPDRDETTKYLTTVAEHVADVLRSGTAPDVAAHLARYTVHHHDTHTEAFTYTRQALGHPFPPLPGPLIGEQPVIGKSVRGDVEFDGGPFVMGGLRSDPFVYDNEKWAHTVQVAPFRMARTAVTQQEFQSFVDDGGYSDSRLWADGGDWLARTGASAPIYWRHDPETGWQRRHFDQWVTLEPDAPVSFVCWWEADAWCRWAGRRLPTEPEWEFACTDGDRRGRALPWGAANPDPSLAATDWLAGGPAPVHACPGGYTDGGLRQMIGNVWEWTSTTFDGYPNFERDSYGENSEQFFGGRTVLRGGSWATRGRYVRSTLRNYFTRDRRDVLAGFRTCARDTE